MINVNSSRIPFKSYFTVFSRNMITNIRIYLTRMPHRLHTVGKSLSFEIGRRVKEVYVNEQITNKIIPQLFKSQEKQKRAPHKDH